MHFWDADSMKGRAYARPGDQKPPSPRSVASKSSTEVKFPPVRRVQRPFERYARRGSIVKALLAAVPDGNHQLPLMVRSIRPTGCPGTTPCLWPQPGARQNRRQRRIGDMNSRRVGNSIGCTRRQLYGVVETNSLESKSRRRPGGIGRQRKLLQPTRGSRILTSIFHHNGSRSRR